MQIIILILLLPQIASLIVKNLKYVLENLFCKLTNVSSLYMLTLPWATMESNTLFVDTKNHD